MSSLNGPPQTPFNVWQKVTIVFLNLTFLRGYFQTVWATGMAQGWTLTVEECFYFSAPFLLLAARRSNWALVLSPVLFLGVGVLLVRTLVPLHLFGAPMSSLKFMINLTFFGHSAEFVIGMLLALYLAKCPGRPSGWVTGASLGGLLGCMAAIAILEAGSERTLGNNSVGTVVLNGLVLPVFICGLLYGLMHEKTWLRALLGSKPFDLLGRASYAFYLVHLGVFNIALTWHVSHNLLVRFVLLNLLAISLYKLVEHPLQQRIAAWAKPSLPLRT